MLKQMDNAAKLGLHRSPALAELFDSLGGKDALSTLAELLDELPLGVALVGVDDDSFPVLYVNSRACTIAEADSEEVVGRPLGEAFPAAEDMVRVVHEAHEHAGRRQARYRTEAGRSWQFQAVGLRRARKGGAGVLATWHEAPEQAGDRRPPATAPHAGEASGSSEPAQGRRQRPLESGIEAGGSLDPVNARRYDRAQETARRLQVGVDVAMEVATRLEPEEVVESVVHRALEAVEAERATLGRLEGGLQCTVLGSVDRSDRPPPVGLTVSLEGQEPAVQAISSRRPAQGRLAYEEIGLRPLRWSLVIPLVAGGELIALLGVGRD